MNNYEWSYPRPFHYPPPSAGHVHLFSNLCVACAAVQEGTHSGFTEMHSLDCRPLG